MYVYENPQATQLYLSICMCESEVRMRIVNIVMRMRRTMYICYCVE